MNDWICPLEEIDSDIRETVRIAFENGMRPYMSCSGSLKDHDGKGAIPIAGTIELLDSEYMREIMAILIADSNYACSIRKQGATVFYDNVLPEGLNFQLEFENVCGDVQETLSQLFAEVVNGRKALPEQRKNVDVICDLVNQFDVRNGSRISFTFNNPNVPIDRENDENYSISITGTKELESTIQELEDIVDDVEQEGGNCIFYGKELATMGAVLRKVVEDYSRVPRKKKDQTIKRNSASSRKNIFLERYNARKEEARTKLESVDFQQEYFSVDDLNDFFDL